MPSKRWLTAVVSSGSSLVVAGGSTGYKKPKLSTVEVMDIWTLQWIPSSLPQPLHEATMTICGNLIYMLARGFDEGDKQSKSVFACSLPALLQSCQQQSLRERLKTSLTRRPKVWHQLADTPVTLSTCKWTTAGSGWTGFR